MEESTRSEQRASNFLHRGGQEWNRTMVKIPILLSSHFHKSYIPVKKSKSYGIKSKIRRIGPYHKKPDFVIFR